MLSKSAYPLLVMPGISDNVTLLYLEARKGQFMFEASISCDEDILGGFEINTRSRKHAPV